MNVYTNEHEQLEALKEWWKRNGKLVIGTVIIAIVISFAWRYWQQHRLEKLTEASVLYERLLINIANHDDTSFKQVSNRLEKNYANTLYADLVGLFIARKTIEEGKLELAGQQLQQVMKQASASYIRQIARIRAARLLLEQNKPKQALDLLEKVDDEAYSPAIHLLKGDIYTALNQPDQAHQAYQIALAKIPSSEPMYAIAQMKLER